MKGIRFPLTLAGVYAACAVVFTLFGSWGMAGGFGTLSFLLVAASVVIHLRNNHHERKSNGRYRKASEAHRTGAGRRAGKNTAARARAHRDAVRAGAGMSVPIPPHASHISLHSSAAEALYAKLAAGLLPSGSGADFSPTPRPAGEFDGKEAEFAPGVVTGTRSFDVDKLGRLLGVAYAAVWLPGENQAKCMDRSYDFAYSSTLRPEWRVMESGRPPHSMTVCGHGLYGYYEGSNDYYSPGRVMGVVEAYGETIIGTRGFRASKARIVALHIPEEVSSAQRGLIVRNYPDVAVFDSFEAMVAEFPADDAGNGLNPSTDPDFWTRGTP